MSKLTVKQRRFVYNHLAGQPGPDAILNAGYNPKNRENASKMAWQFLNESELIQLEIARILDRTGLDDQSLADSLKEIITLGKLNKATASDALRAIHMAFQLKDRFPAKKIKEAKVEAKFSYEDKTVKDLQAELEQLRRDTQELLSRIEKV